MSENIDLFGNPVHPELKKKSVWNKTGVSMHSNLLQVYGKVDDKCKNCKHLQRYRYSQVFYKCAIAEPNVKSGPSGDWRVNWQACGKFEADEN